LILEEHWPYYKDLAQRGCLNAPLLTLGHQQSVLKMERNAPTAVEAFKILGVDEMQSLDPDGGDINSDLNDDLKELSQQYETVFNIGTIEHVWDVHTAWSNALRAVKTGGHFITITPVMGWDGHGIHITERPYIRNFVLSNGFEQVMESAAVERKGVNYWLAAKKMRHIERIADYTKPQQRYYHGVKAA
jgi:hypothetical protein